MAWSQLCAAFEVSRSGYYAWRERGPSARQEANARLVEEMQSIRQGEEVCYGSPRMPDKRSRVQTRLWPEAETVKQDGTVGNRSGIKKIRDELARA